MQTFTIQDLVEIDVPDDYRLLTPDEQPHAQPRGIARLLATMGLGGAKHRRHVVLGAAGVQLEFHAWHKDASWDPPSPIHQRPVLNQMYGPVGGIVRERGQMEIQGEAQPWIIREKPGDVTWDADSQRPTTMPFSFDVEVDFDGAAKFVKVQCRLPSVDSKLVETYQSLVASLRPC